MQEEPRDWHHLQSKNMWPDRIIYKDESDGQTHLIFIIDKGNNRALSTDREFLVRLFEQAGLKVMLSYAGQLMTLDEFNSGQGYRLATSGWARQAYYNAKSDLNRLEQIIAHMSIEDPAYPGVARQIDSQRKRLSANAPLIGLPKSTPETSIMPESDDKATTVKRRALCWQFKTEVLAMGLPEERAFSLWEQMSHLERLVQAKAFYDEWMPKLKEEAATLRSEEALNAFQQLQREGENGPDEGGTSPDIKKDGGVTG